MRARREGPGLVPHPESEQKFSAAPAGLGKINAQASLSDSLCEPIRPADSEEVKKLQSLPLAGRCRSSGDSTAEIYFRSDAC